MNISRKDVDALNAVVTIDIAESDYKEKVDQVLSDYRRTANIPGFRKGHVPMGMVRKQYGKAVLVDEVNKLIQENLNKFLTEEKIDILGNPMPVEGDEIDWNSGNFSFDFELGLSPEFDVNLTPKKAITHYVVSASDKMIDDQIKNIQKQYGKLVAKNEISAGDEVTGTFNTADDTVADKKATIELADVKGKTNQKLFIGAKPGEVLSVKAKSLFTEEHLYTRYLGLTEEDAKGLELSIAIEEVNTRELAEMNQELFDKLFGEGVVTSEEELRGKIIEDADKQFVQQGDQKLLTDVTETLIEQTEFDLPHDFLKRWIMTAGEQEMTAEEAVAEYERTEKGLRYQLIEAKLVKDNELQLTFDELKAHAGGMIRAQLAQFGRADAEDSEVDEIVARIMQNEDEVRRMSENLQNQKMLDFFKSNVKLKEKKVNYDEFIKEAYSA